MVDRRANVSPCLVLAILVDECETGPDVILRQRVMIIRRRLPRLGFASFGEFVHPGGIGGDKFRDGIKIIGDLLLGDDRQFRSLYLQTRQPLP
ncbi:hypothetical protein GCM10011504_57330 [Siccirubricoccus deserti]|nr:hypothetical protein GCM10011504_57330 [Siccirubricoccus deserti]